MGTVLFIWALHAAAIFAPLLQGHSLSGFAARLVAAFKSGPVIGLTIGSLAFLFAAASAMRSGDTLASMIALGSFALDFSLLGIVFFNILFRRRGGGGIDMVFGSARFATPEHAHVMGLVGSTGLRLGTLRNPDPEARAKDAKQGITRPLHYTGERHLLTVAPTRAGKGVSVIIPNLKTYSGSCIVIDPKGENMVATAEARAAFSKVYILAPWLTDAHGKTSGHRFNPLDILTPDSPTLIEDALLIADALVLNESSVAGSHGSFWSDEARALITGFILHIATSKAEARNRHLGRLRDMLCAPPTQLADIGMAMAKSPIPAVVSAAARFISKSDNERSGVLSTAQQNTHFLDSPALRDNLSRSDFRFADLKGDQQGDKPVSVYIVLPVDRLGTYSRWLRLLIALGIADLARNPAKPQKPVWCVLDEFAQLGRLKIIEDAYGLMAGLGLQLHAIVQDLSQLERLYDKGWQTFIANAGVIQVFGTRDLHTAEYISKMLGVTTQMVTSSSSGTSSGTGGDGKSTSGSNSTTNFAPTARPLLFPDELMRMDRNAQILFVEGADPVLGNKIPPEIRR